MDDRAIAFAIPLFVISILVELAWNVFRGDARYRFHDSIASLSCGIGQVMIDATFRAITFGGYVVAWRYLRVATISEHSVAAWIAITLALDLCYYVFHRASHRVNFLWAMHAVHHQSEEYNLSTALRQSWFDPFVLWVFYLPLAIAGFPPAMYAIAATLNLLYQFFIHTRAVRTLGPIEWIFNTPSHHRVHHGIDPKYIDKNYAGIFIVWDRLFRTFERESVEPIYGTVKPLESWDALWANVAEWSRLVSLARGATTFRERVWTWLAPPEWRPVALGGNVTVPEVDRTVYRKFQTHATRGVNAYVAASFVIAMVSTTLLLYFAEDLPFYATLLLAASLLAMTRGWSGLMEVRANGVRYEVVRGVVTIAAIAVLAWHGVLSWNVAGILVGTSTVLVVWSALLRTSFEATIASMRQNIEPTAAE